MHRYVYSSLTQPAAISPIRVFVLVLAVVFAVEAGVMFVLMAIPGVEAHTVAVSLIDATLLAAALCPALWLLIVRPLRALVAERGALLKRVLTIQEEERAQLARDLHDELGQLQTAVLLGCTAILNAGTQAEALERAQGVRQSAAAAVDSTRRIARRLSPGVLRDFGLARAAERLCEDIAAASGLAVLHDLQIGAARFDPAVEIAAYRITQEALTNAVKHADASQIRVEMRLAGGRLVVSIADNGSGFRQAADQAAAAGQGLGLVGMRERVSLLGGEFRIESAPSSGTTLRAAFPARPIEA